MTGHRFSPDMKILFASERRGQNSEERRDAATVIEFAVALNQPAQKYTLARYRADDVMPTPDR